MTVEELIDQLKQYDPDIKVRIAVDYRSADVQYVEHRSSGITLSG